MEISSKSHQEEATTDSNTSLNSSTASIELNDSFPEEEAKKAEEYKQKGNEAYKGKNKFC